MKNLENKVIMTAEITGPVVKGSSDFSKTTKMIAECACRCWEAGAAVVHLQMAERAKAGRRTELCLQETIYQIREYKDCDVIIDCSEPGKSWIPGDNFKDKMQKNKAQVQGIEMGAYGAEYFNWVPGGRFENTAQLWQSINQAYKDRGIKPEVVIRDSGTLSIVNYLLFTEKNYFAAKDLLFQFRLGFKNSMKATVENLLQFKSGIPKGALWSVFGAGDSQFEMMYAALALGGNICIGTKDVVLDDSAPDALENQLIYVERAAQAVEAFGKTCALPSEAREMLGLRPFESMKEAM